jgi:hypothetical protein
VRPTTRVRITSFGILTAGARLAREIGASAESGSRLVSEGGDLAIELADRPASVQCLALVVLARLRIRDGEQADIV